MDSIFGYYYHPPTMAESIMEVGEILPTGTVLGWHRWRPTARDYLSPGGRFRGDVGSCDTD